MSHENFQEFNPIDLSTGKEVIPEEDNTKEEPSQLQSGPGWREIEPMSLDIDIPEGDEEAAA